jgi:hypothetical protein
VAARNAPEWESFNDEKILDLKLNELHVSIKGTWLERPIAGLYEELEARDLKLRPHFWLSNEWFSPSGVPGIAIPFYLAHRRLKRLEGRQMLEVEGATYRECMQILRHEAGHAIDHAFDLSRRKRWKEMFGKSSDPYPKAYQPNPTSRSYVMHLPRWYAQSHPDEDFAETFAVWMTPRSRWRERYRGWQALRKLEYVDELMTEIAGKKPKVVRRKRVDPLSKLNMTLRDHYRKKREHYRQSFANIYDHELRRLFAADDRRTHTGVAASAFLRQNRREIRQMVAKWTGEYELTLDHVLQDMITRCRELRLRAVGSERKLKMDFAILLTAKAVQYVHRNREWHAV